MFTAGYLLEGSYFDLSGLIMLDRMRFIFVVFVLWLTNATNHATASKYPIPRQFIHLSLPIETTCQPSPLLFRVLQFNVLADGLSGLKEDLGKFSRTNQTILKWDNRKDQLLKEITDINADVITLQECDHYYDFFLPQLNSLGYSGYFAPKPTSACLEVSDNGDGCALFVRRSKMRVISCESKTLALSIAGFKEGELQEDDKNIKAQNQVGLIAVCEFVDWNATVSTASNTTILDDSLDVNRNSMARSNFSSRKLTPPPPLIICTTHLKSLKSATGERYRQQGILDVLERIDSLFVSFSAAGKKPAVLLTGDFNAVPKPTDICAPLTYRAVKNHRLSLRSVYNEDIDLDDMKLSSYELYTTWKARRRNSNNEETVIKRCIDYIFYCPYVSKDDIGAISPVDAIKGTITTAGLDANTDLARKSKTVAVTPAQVAQSMMLRFSVYFCVLFVPVLSFVAPSDSEFWLVSSFSRVEQFLAVFSAVLFIRAFNVFTDGTLFQPVIPAKVSTTIAANAAIPVALSTSKESLNQYFWPKFHSFGERMQQRPFDRESRPGLRAIAALDLYSDEQIGDALMPSERYPSDHLAIAADLQLLWDEQ